MLIPSKVWVVDRWVTFSLNIGDYQNIIAFLDTNGLSFLTLLNLDFTQIPSNLHGRGNSTNLLEYLSNNSDDNTLINQFFYYFLNNIIFMSYSSGQKVNFNINGNAGWQNMLVNIYSPYIPPTTTTTTVSPTTTTTTTVSPTTTTTTEIPTTTTTTEVPTTTTTTEVPTTTTTTEVPTTTTTSPPTTTTTTTLFVGIIVTDSISEISNTGATTYITITSSGETAIILCGIVWSTHSGAIFGVDSSTSPDGSPHEIGIQYSSKILELIPSTTYYARSFLAGTGGSVSYGNEIIFVAINQTGTTTTTTTLLETTTTTTLEPTTTTTTTVATEYYYLTSKFTCLDCTPTTTDYPITDSRSGLTLNKYYLDTISTDIFQITGTHTFGIQSTNLTGSGSDTCGELSCGTTTTTEAPTTTTTTDTPTTTTTTDIPTTTTTTTSLLVSGFMISGSTPLETDFSILNLINNVETSFNTPIVDSFNYLYITIPQGKTLQVLDAMDFNITNTFSLISSQIFYGNNNNLYRTNDVFYTGIYEITYKIKIY